MIIRRKKFKFDHTNKWYMHNPDSDQEKMYKNPLGLWDTDGSPNLAQMTWLRDSHQQKKKKKKKGEHAVLFDHWVKLKKSEKDRYLDLARELKKTIEHESDGDTDCNWCAWYSHQRIDKETGGLGN